MLGVTIRFDTYENADDNLVCLWEKVESFYLRATTSTRTFASFLFSIRPFFFFSPFFPSFSLFPFIPVCTLVAILASSTYSGHEDVCSIASCVLHVRELHRRKIEAKKC